MDKILDLFDQKTLVALCLFFNEERFALITTIHQTTDKVELDKLNGALNEVEKLLAMAKEKLTK